MKTLDATNPILVAETFTRHFLTLPADELSKELRAAYQRALECSRADDSDLCAKLGEEELDEYSVLVASFKMALQRMESFKSLLESNNPYVPRGVVPFVANLMAWQNILSTFRNLNG